jgi:hypothetical protein
MAMFKQYSIESFAFPRETKLDNFHGVHQTMKQFTWDRGQFEIAQNLSTHAFAPVA